MIAVSCPLCQSPFNFEDSQNGLTFNCTKCGREMAVAAEPASVGAVAVESASDYPQVVPPPNQPVLGTSVVEIPPKETPPSSSPPSPPGPHYSSVSGVHDEPASGQALLVRFFFGDYSRKFTTELSLPEVRKIVRRVLDNFGIDMDERGDIDGEIRYASSSFLKLKVRGEAFQHRKKNEFIVDVSHTTSVTGVGILLCILCWPLLIVGAVTLPNQAKEEFHREMKEVFRAVERKLKK